MAFDDTPQTTTSRTVVGMFTNRSDAEAAIRDLKSSGFGDDQIGVAMQDRAEQQALAEGSGSQVAEGAATGAVSGGIVGGLIGLLGSLLIPGVGPIVVGGVLASTLTGAGIGAATGGLIGALIGMGVPEEDAQHFDTGLRSGAVLVTVDASGQTAEALDILQRHGADFGPSGRDRYGAGQGATLGGAATGDVAAPGLGSSASADLGLGVEDAYTPSSTAGIGGVGAGIGAGDVASGSSTGTRGMSPADRGETATSSWTGEERRRYSDPAYTGPERRLVGV